MAAIKVADASIVITQRTALLHTLLCFCTSLMLSTTSQCDNLCIYLYWDTLSVIGSGSETVVGQPHSGLIVAVTHCSWQSYEFLFYIVVFL